MALHRIMHIRFIDNLDNNKEYANNFKKNNKK